MKKSIESTFMFVQSNVFLRFISKNVQHVQPNEFHVFFPWKTITFWILYVSMKLLYTRKQNFLFDCKTLVLRVFYKLTATLWKFANRNNKNNLFLLPVRQPSPLDNISSKYNLLPFVKFHPQKKLTFIFRIINLKTKII